MEVSPGLLAGHELLNILKLWVSQRSFLFSRAKAKLGSSQSRNLTSSRLIVNYVKMKYYQSEEQCSLFLTLGFTFKSLY